MTEKISYVEIDLSRCSNTYSEGPCTASIPATGDIKCFNCWATCQDKPNYAKEIATSRHSTVTSKPPIDIDAIPDIESISIRPAKLDLGESIGVRASINITFKDSRYPDTGPEGDRYLSDRNYDPYTQGSYWGKFRARFPYVKGSDIRLIRGDSDQALAQMDTRHFIVETVAGPDSSGTFTIQCKDALKLADGKQSQCPIVSTGVTEFDITDVATAFVLAPAGIGNAEYPASGVINLGGKELCKFTRSGDTMDIGTVGERGAFGTTAVSHSAGDRAQIAIEFPAQRASLILQSLFEDYASVPTSYIPISDWIAEDTAYIDRNYTAVIAEPENVDKLVNEILQQTASTVWWDDVNKLIQFKTLKAVDTNAATYTDDLILADSFSAKDQNDKRVSQVWTFYGQINPLEKLDEKSNYSQGRVIFSTESEANFEGVPSIKSIFSRWIPVNGEDAATRLNQLILSRYTTPPRLVTFNLQKDFNLVIPTLANGYNVSNFTIQDETGALKIMPIQLTQVKDSEATYSVIGEEVLYTDTVSPDDPNIKPVPLYTGLNQNIRDVFDTIFPSVASGDTVNVTIGSGQVLGSADTSLPSLITGNWPAGVTLNLLNNGSVIGAGGAGGAGGGANTDINFGDGANGIEGGDAIDFTYDVNLENNGDIGGGGGGGGGGGAAVLASLSPPTGYVGGGGGGAGVGVGLGGSGGLGRASGAGQAGADGVGGGGSNYVLEGNGATGTNYTDNVGNFVSGGGGDGGSLGQIGAAGQDAQIGGLLASGGLGGLAGDAINKNGNTVIITGTGTIYGDVNP